MKGVTVGALMVPFLVLAGCVGSSPGEQIGQQLGQIFLGGSLARNGGTRLSTTELSQILTTNSSPEWPRVAVTFNRLPPWFSHSALGSMSRLGHYGPQDCVNISVRLWLSAKRSKDFDNIDFCGDDIPINVPFHAVSTMWVNFAFATGQKNTGRKRTSGPTPPDRLFPNNPGVDTFWGHGEYYLGGIMATVGYNWNYSDDRRFWVVSIPLP